MTQDEYIDALKQALSDYDTRLSQIINVVAPHLETLHRRCETLHRRCETLLHAEIEDDAEPWSAEQLNYLARQYNAIANAHNEEPVIITTTEAPPRDGPGTAITWKKTW